jgi:hypothetical protein
MADETELRDAAVLLWEEARRQLERQEADLDSLKTRALATLSVAALVAGFFGSRVPKHPSALVTGFVVAALTLFAVSAALAVWVLLPRREGWHFAHFTRGWTERLDALTLTPFTLAYNLAEHFEQYRIANKAKLEHLQMAFLIACLLVGLQVVVWGVATVWA